jgi:dienelactone hydrolase
MSGIRFVTRFCFVAVLLASSTVVGQPPRALVEGKSLTDARLGELRSLNSYFPFEPSETPQQWAERKQGLRRHLLVSLGLWPMPSRTPANPVIHGRVDREDYSVERVYFESFPGFYVTGSLYRPKGRTGKLPGVLCPHGHWANGRFYDTGEAKIKEEIAAGAERFEEGGRSPLQARCVHLARMGCVVFHYDMIGYADSVQISQAIAHGFRKQRPEMNVRQRWGLFSPQAESHAQSVMGMQTFNSIRALDFLLELPDVDPQRIGVTGASGGGTQTFILGALDDRPHVAFPAVMVSTAMQGGCTCENCNLLRVGTGNVEFAAMFAPRPLGLTAADDWTKEMQTKGFPELQRHYGLLGAADNVTLKPDLQFGHNYNLVGRTAMYELFHRVLRPGGDAAEQERDYRRLSIEEMTVWTAEHPKPPTGPEVERDVLEWWSKDSDAQLARLTPRDRDTLAEYRTVVGGALESIIGRALPGPGESSYEQVVEREHEQLTIMAGLLSNPRHNESIPVAFVHPKNWNGRVAIWLAGKGKSSLFGDDGLPKEAIQKLVSAGVSVVGVDLLYQGESLPDGQPVTETRTVDQDRKPNEIREFAGYTFGYNPTVFASRVHDVLSVLALVKHHELQPKRIDLVGVDGLGPVAVVAAALARDALGKVAIDTRGFRFGELSNYRDVDFLPAAAKYGDLPGLMALIAPRPLLVAGEATHGMPLVAAYTSAGTPRLLQRFEGPAGTEAAGFAAFLAD